MFIFQFLDKRVQRTKSDLYNALFDLLKERKYEQISVKDIVNAAGYSRGVFYTHYKQKDDLLDEVIDYLFREAKKAQRTSYRHSKFIDIKDLVNEPVFILTHFKEYGTYYQLLLKENIKGPFSIQLTNTIIEAYLADFEMEQSEQDRAINNMLNRYYAYGLMGLIIEWIMADFPTEPQVFSDELVKVFKYSLEKIQIKYTSWSRFRDSAK